MSQQLVAITNPALEPGLIQQAGGFGEFVTIIINMFYVLGGIVVLVYLVYGGFIYVSSSGDEKSTSKARKILSDAVIGSIILVASVPFAKIIGNLFGLELFNIQFPKFTP